MKLQASPDLEGRPRQRFSVGWLLAGLAGVACVAVVVLWPTSPAPLPAVVTSTSGARPSTSSTGTAPTSSTVKPTTTVALAAPESVPPVDLEPARQTAAGFVVAWLRPASFEERVAALEPVTSSRLLSLAADIPPENLPAAELVGVGDVTWDGYTAVVPGELTDGSHVKVTLQQTAVGWRVTGIDRA